jgi:hypothetical protein
LIGLRRTIAESFAALRDIAQALARSRSIGASAGREDRMNSAEQSGARRLACAVQFITNV